MALIRHGITRSKSPHHAIRPFKEMTCSFRIQAISLNYLKYPAPGWPYERANPWALALFMALIACGALPGSGIVANGGSLTTRGLFVMPRHRSPLLPLRASAGKAPPAALLPTARHPVPIPEKNPPDSGRVFFQFHLEESAYSVIFDFAAL